MLCLLERVTAAPSVDAFADAVTVGIRDVLPCDFASYNEVDPVHGRALFVCDPPEVIFPGVAVLFAEHLNEHPLVGHHHRTGTGEAIMVSDFLSVRQFRATGLHHEVFQPVGIDHLMSITFSRHVGGDGFVALAVHRGFLDFTGRERALLDAMRPHLITAHQAAEGRELLRHSTDMLDQQGRHLVLADRAGAIREASPQARAALAQHFGPSAQDGVLPDLLRPLTRPADRRMRPSLTCRAPLTGQALRVAVLQRTHTRVTMLMEVPDAGEAQVPEAGPPLTGREHEVLELVARGLTNRQVAERLGVTASTVKSHLENIYVKLGVRTRTAAAATVRARQG